MSSVWIWRRSDHSSLGLYAPPRHSIVYTSKTRASWSPSPPNRNCPIRGSERRAAVSGSKQSSGVVHHWSVTMSSSASVRRFYTRESSVSSVHLAGFRNPTSTPRQVSSSRNSSRENRSNLSRKASVPDQVMPPVNGWRFFARRSRRQFEVIHSAVLQRGYPHGRPTTT